MAPASSSSDGPVMTLVNKKIRALKKKRTKILLLEESISDGRTPNDDQLELLRSKPSVLTLIDEYEKLRQPLSAALHHEITHHSPPPPVPAPVVAGDGEALVRDVIKLVYLGSLFDVKAQSDFTNLMLSRTMERECCLTYDYETEDAGSDILQQKDLDLIAMLGGKMVSRPPSSALSHREALERCLLHAKYWLSNSDKPIEDGVDVTYAGLRQRLNKILALDYMTKTPELKAPIDCVAASTAGQCIPTNSVLDDFAPCEQKESEPSSVGGISVKQQNKLESYDQHRDFREVESEDQQQGWEYPKYRQGNRGGGGGRRGYPNGRGGRNNRGGGQNYDRPGNYYRPMNKNTRGRGGTGRGAGVNGYNNQEALHY